MAFYSRWWMSPGLCWLLALVAPCRALVALTRQDQAGVGKISAHSMGRIFPSLSSATKDF